ncbi:MAG: hypothetical protein KC733_03430 [Candidatus Omnitrophica bacterium]|nr:hypothetical protein [Candidatus Omnitrophota bacterium]
MSVKRLSSMHKKIKKAMSEAVFIAVKEHEELGVPLAIWKNGKVVKISAKNFRLK